MSAEVVARWEAFIQKISGRYQEVLAEADAGFADLIATDPTDTITYGNAMMGIHTRVLGLGKMLSDTYQNQVSPQMTSEEDNAGRDRLDAVQKWLTRIGSGGRSITRRTSIARFGRSRRPRCKKAARATAAVVS